MVTVGLIISAIEGVPLQMSRSRVMIYDFCLQYFTRYLSMPWLLSFVHYIYLSPIIIHYTSFIYLFFQRNCSFSYSVIIQQYQPDSSASQSVIEPSSPLNHLFIHRSSLAKLVTFPNLAVSLMLLLWVFVIFLFSLRRTSTSTLYIS